MELSVKRLCKIKCIMHSFIKSFDLVAVVVLFIAVIFCHMSTLTEAHGLKSRLFRNANITKPNISNVSAQRISQKASLPLGLTLIGSVGNKSFYTDTDKLGLAWTEALDFCHGLGLNLASLESLAEHKLTRNYLGKLPHRFFWLAGTDYFNEGNWKWLKSGETFKFKKWTQGFPSKSRKNNCLYLSYGNDGWIDASCSSNKLIIRPLCQAEKN